MAWKPRGGGGGERGGYSGFQVTGMIEWEQNSKKKKNLYGFKQPPKNPWTKISAP